MSQPALRTYYAALALPLTTGTPVYKAEDVRREVVPFLKLGMQRYAELFEAANLGEAKDSVFIQEAQRLLALMEEG